MKSMKPLISVIVPVYKVEQYLHKCIDSILAQTYQNLEIFLVDDGSPDQCGIICDNYQEKDKRIKVIHKQNEGLSEARNEAIKIATGEWIVFVDSDDYVSANYIELLHDLVFHYHTQMAITSLLAFEEGTIPIDNSCMQSSAQVMTTEKALTQLFYQRDFDCSAVAKIYHRSLFANNIRYPKGLLFEDLITTYRIIKQCDKVVFCNSKTYYYLIRKSSIMGKSFQPLKYESCIKILDAFKADMPSLPHRVRKALSCRLVSFLFNVLLQVPKCEHEVRKRLFSEIKLLRRQVLFDYRARRKARIACLLSYGGLNMVEAFADFGKTRK